MTRVISLLLLSLSLSFSLSFLHVESASSGQLSYCNLDLTVRKYGNIPTSAAPKNVVSVMPWVKPPVNTNFYTVRTGDKQDIAKDPTSYIPDRWTPIHIRVHDLDRKYIGLVMYATNGNMSVGGQQVGEWKVTDNLPFWSPAACPTAITHKDADIKPIHTVFYFKAPAGTGRVKFHVMIKQGEQGKGNFYFPEQSLILNEGTTPALSPTIRYIQAGEKQSCAAACTAHATHKYCDVTATNNLNSPTALSAATQGLYLCRPQIVSGCASSAPLSLDNFCSYKQTTAQCKAESRASTPTSCTAVPDATLDNDDYITARFCACSLTVPIQTGVPTDGPVATDPPTDTPTKTPNNNGTGTGLNAASSLSASSYAVSLPLVLTMCSSLFLSNSRRMSLLLALVMLVSVYCIPSAHAHNWVMSPSRALVASVTKPCQARISPFPHIQVTPGQKFPMEWSVGHGDSRTKSYYWALVNAKDYQQLYFVEDALLEDYIRSAPPSGANVRWYNRTTTAGSTWEKRHIGNPNESDRDTFPIYESKYFAFVSINQSTDPNHIVRDAIYREKSTFGPKNPALYTQWAFLANQTAKDARVSYKSDKYPWLIAVHRFINVFDEHNPYAHQANIAQFEIPAGSAPGDYVYHFKWGGYRDCVDINVMAKNNTFTEVPLPFGKSIADANAAANGTAPFVKLDHCEFLFIHNPMTQCRIVSRQSTADASQCIADCAKNGACTGVQLVRATNPSAVSLPYAPAVPYYAWNNTVPDMNGNPTKPVWACEWHSNNARMNAGCNTPHSKLIDNNAKRPNPAYSCNYDVLRNMSKPASERLQDDDYICFGLQPYRDQDLQAAEDFMTVNDPEDPKFYSTCWIRIEPGGFLDSPRPPPIVPDWAAGDSCVSCSFINSVTKLPMTAAPKWTDALTNQCRNCDQPDL